MKDICAPIAQENRLKELYDTMQQLGDYSFRSYRIGRQRIVLRNSDLLQPNSPAQAQEIKELAMSFSQTNGQALNLAFITKTIKKRQKKLR